MNCLIVKVKSYSNALNNTLCNVFLYLKKKIDESSSSDSQNTDQDSDSGSSDDQDTVTRGKDASKRPGNSDEEVQKVFLFQILCKNHLEQVAMFLLD